MLRRLLAYAEKRFELSQLLAAIPDRRPRPQITTQTVLRSLLALFWLRFGSLHSLEQTKRSAFWFQWLGADLPSADTLGRVAALIDPDDVRATLHRLYTQLKRKKTLPPTTHGLTALVIDGHESHATYRRQCEGCLERRVRTRRGYRTQYYHRSVTAMLLGGDFPILLDAEPQTSVDEIDASLRLLRRVLERYPRAFDVLLGDALYTDARIYRLLLAHGKDVLTVLKRNTPDLLQEANALFDADPPDLLVGEDRIWDGAGFTSFPQLPQPVRVVRSQEMTQIRRQLGGTGTVLSQWLWVTTLSPQRGTTEAVVGLGHARWKIENRGFNETTNHWHADHVYRHEATALLVFWLLAMMAYNLFHVFFRRHLKPAFRRAHSYQHVARCLAADLYARLPSELARPP